MLCRTGSRSWLLVGPAQRLPIVRLQLSLLIQPATAASHEARPSQCFPNNVPFKSSSRLSLRKLETTSAVIAAPARALVLCCQTGSGWWPGPAWTLPIVRLQMSPQQQHPASAAVSIFPATWMSRSLPPNKSIFASLKLLCAHLQQERLQPIESLAQVASTLSCPWLRTEQGDFG